jgi:hypothetical protein
VGLPLHLERLLVGHSRLHHVSLYVTVIILWASAVCTEHVETGTIGPGGSYEVVVLVNNAVISVSAGPSAG